jgi:hypothetical protein
MLTKRTAPCLATVASMLLVGISSGCGGDDRQTSDRDVPEATTTLPPPTPLNGPVTPCDLLLPAEVGHHLEMAAPTPEEDPTTPACDYSADSGPILRTQLQPATDNADRDLDLALLGMGPAEPIQINGQLAASVSDGSGVTSLAVAIDDPRQIMTLSAYTFADGMVPGTDELAVPGDERVAVAQQEALEALTQIALVRLGVDDESGSLPPPTPIADQISGCDLLTTEEVSHHLDAPPTKPQDDSFVPDPGSDLDLPPMLNCSYTDPATETVMLYASVDSYEPGMMSVPAALDLQMTGLAPPEDITVGGHPGVFAEGAQDGAMPKLAVAAPAGEMTSIMSLQANSTAASRETLQALAEIALVRLGVPDA